MTGSTQRPDAGSPAQVSSASFPSVRRGFDPDAVQRFLRAVAGELQRAHDRVEALEGQLRAADARARGTSSIDEDTAVRLLGEEAARILQTAREASQQIRAKAEEAANRVVREANEEAARIRDDSEREASRRQVDAAADAEAQIEMAKQQGRDMVAEAREYRERVLADVARRREIARQQIEQLVHGRERVVHAFERARLAASDVLAGMAPTQAELANEVADFVSLEPTTGPVAVVGDARPPEDIDSAEAAAAEEVEKVERADTRSEADAQPAEDPADDPAASQVSARGPTLSVVPNEGDNDRVIPMRSRATAEPHVPNEDADEDATEDTSESSNDTDEDAADGAAGETDDSAPAPVVALFAGEVHSDRADDHAAPPAPPSEAVDDLFAKLRAASSETVAREVAAEAPEQPVAAPEPESESETDADGPFARRDEVLVPLILATSRKLKRVLADQQNTLFDAVRRHTGKQKITAVATLLPPLDEHVALYRTAIDEQLMAAALAGAASVSTATTATLKKSLKDASVLAPTSDALREDMVQPLRDRLERCLLDADSDLEDFVASARSAYREWKSQSIDEHVDDVIHLAYGRGAHAVLAEGASVCWLVDPKGPACPDAEDNALAGVVSVGEAFPTGHLHPPAHAGCRCVLGLPSE